VTSRGLDTALKVGESLLNFATKKKLTGLSSSTSKVRMTAEARSKLKEAESVLENYREDLVTLSDEFEKQKQEIVDKWNNEKQDISVLKITPTKQNIRITHFGILWDAESS